MCYYRNCAHRHHQEQKVFLRSSGRLFADWLELQWTTVRGTHMKAVSETNTDTDTLTPHQKNHLQTLLSSRLGQ